ncbi:MAG: hypothetical protein R3321_06655 [Nitrososphaeraceae archaeon]|nr:hypothetical protein [Nitrososphaeraceae archaeon]
MKIFKLDEENYINLEMLVHLFITKDTKRATFTLATDVENKFKREYTLSDKQLSKLIKYINRRLV